MKGILLFAALALAGPAPAQDRSPNEPSPSEIVTAAPDGDWAEIAPDDLLVMELAQGRDTGKREVVIQLIPPPFSQGWVDNIRTLAMAHWWDGTSVYRVQDNYVAQWGLGEDKQPPEWLKEVPEADYAPFWPGARKTSDSVRRLRERWWKSDPYAAEVDFVDGFPVAEGNRQQWPVHCYGMVGVARGTGDTGSGADLYAVIGQAPRQLDRNIALVGRVIEGMEYLSSLPRGHGELGFYTKDEARKQMPILSVRLASELPEKSRPRFEYLSTDSESFAHYANARANRHDDFYKVPAGGVDICNVPVPIRRVEPAK
jgi:peptidylprolyl isomerase